MRNIILSLTFAVFSLTTYGDIIQSGIDSRGVACFYKISDNNQMQFTFGGSPQNWSDIPLYLSLPLTDGDTTSVGGHSTIIQTSYINGIYSFDLYIVIGNGTNMPLMSIKMLVDPILQKPQEITSASNSGSETCFFN